MKATLCDQVVFHDKWQRRAFHVRTQPLGGRDRAACGTLMSQTLRCEAQAQHVGVLDETGTFDNGHQSHRVVRDALFGGTACLGFGNVWSGALKSRDKLFYAVNAPLAPSPSETRVVTSLRGLLGQPPALPSLGTLAEPPRRQHAGGAAKKKKARR